MKRHLLLFAYICVVISLTATRLSAQSITWKGTTSEWNNAANWEPQRIPQSTDHILINASGSAAPILPDDLSFAGLTLSHKTFDLNGKILTITNTATLTSGTLNNGVLNFAASGNVTFGKCTLNTEVQGQANGFFLNGSVFNRTVTIQKNGSGDNNGAGGNKFFGMLTIINTSSSNIWTGQLEADLFDKDVRLIKLGTGGIILGHNTRNNTFNGDIIVGSTQTGSISIGSIHSNTSTFRLAEGKDFLIDQEFGFSSGAFMINGLIYDRPERFNFKLTGSSTLVLGKRNRFLAPVLIEAPGIQLSGSYFDKKAEFIKTGSSGDQGFGQNVFMDSCIITNAGPGHIYTAHNVADTFHLGVKLINLSSGIITICFYARNNYFGGDVLVSNVSPNGSVSLGSQHNSNTNFSFVPGKGIVVDPERSFTTGGLGIFGYLYNEPEDFKFKLDGNARLGIGGNTTFNVPVFIEVPEISLHGGTYNKPVTILRYGNGNSQGAGGCIFNDDVTVINKGAGSLMLGHNYPDTFNGNAYFYNDSTGSFWAAGHAKNYRFNGDIYFNNSVGGSIQLGHQHATVFLAEGKKIFVGDKGFSRGSLILDNFTQQGNTNQDFHLTGNATLQFIRSTFNGDIDCSAANITFNSAVFNGTATFRRTNGLGANNGNSSSGNNFFYKTFTFISEAAGRSVLGVTNNNTSITTFNFHGDCIIDQQGTGMVTFAPRCTANFHKNLDFFATSNIAALGTNNGAVNFVGQTPSIVRSNKDFLQFANMRVDKEGDVYLETSVELINDNTVNPNILPALHLVKGFVRSTDKFLQLANGGRVHGGSALSAVGAAFRKVGNETFTFPVGAEGKYRPVSITAPAVVTDVFSVKYSDAQGPSPDRLAGDLRQLSHCEHWDFQRLQGSSLVDLTMAWENSCSFIEAGTSFLARFDGDADNWNALNAALNGNGASGSFTKASFSSFGLLSIAYNRQVVIDPVQPVVLNAYASLKSRADGVYYPVDNKLYFKYREEYREGRLNLVIFDHGRRSVTPLEPLELHKQYGMNHYAIDLSKFSLENGRYYTLEVVDEKKQVHKLRFLYNNQ